MTQIGFVGLGKMGGNMVHRIRRDSEHEVVAFDFDEKAVKQAVKTRRLRRRLAADAGQAAAGAPRMVWIMVPAGAPTQETVDKLAKLLDRGDTIVDGGNSKWTDDKRRAGELKKAGIDYVDVGTSGGVWGLEVGYCMMVGGPPKRSSASRRSSTCSRPRPTSRASPRSARAAGCASARPARATT